MDNFDLRKYLAEGRLFEERENQLVIDGDWIKREDNPFLPQEFFGSGDQRVFVHMFSKNAIIYDITGRLLPYLEEFGGYKSSYIGGDVVKLPWLNNLKVALKNPGRKNFTKNKEEYNF
jgi:hypothetical protein